MFKIKTKTGAEYALTKIIIILIVVIFLVWMIFFYFDIKDILFQKAGNLWEMFK